MIIDDIRYLWKTRAWPDGKTPHWAEFYAQELNVDPTHASVVMHGLADEVERLEKESLDKLIEEALDSLGPTHPRALLDCAFLRQGIKETVEYMVQSGRIVVDDNLKLQRKAPVA